MPTYDWVVQNESWRSQAETINYGTSTMWPLLTPHNQIFEAHRMPEVYSGTTAVRVRGVVHWHLYPDQGDLLADVFANTFLSEIAASIVVRDIDPQAPYAMVPEPTYDMRTPETANETWSWSHSTVIGNIGSNVWAGTPAILTPWRGSIFVDARTSRRMTPLQGLWFYLQWGRLATAIGNAFQDLDQGDYAVRLVLVPRLRTLVRLPWR